jgi:hypothetical protein
MKDLASTFAGLTKAYDQGKADGVAGRAQKSDYGLRFEQGCYNDGYRHGKLVAVKAKKPHGRTKQRKH